MLHLEVVNPAEHLDRVRPMLEANWAEAGFDFEFAPDVSAYQRMHDAGVCFAVLASFDGIAVGYCTVTVVPHPHNPAVVVASNDALFVHPDMRGGTTSARLIRFAEDEAKRRGAHKFTWHCRAGTPFADMLTRHGYEPVDVVVCRGL